MPSERSSHFTLNDFSVRTADGLETAPLRATIKEGETLLIVGPASSGKSIIFEALSGIRRPGIRHIGNWEGRARLIPQDARVAALPTDNVWSVLSLKRGALVRRRLLGFGSPGSALEERASRLFSELGLVLSQIFDRPLSSLSAGERRRVLCVAALLEPPPTLLIDGWEEFADPGMRKNLLLMLSEHRRQGMSVVVSARHFPVLDLDITRALELAPPIAALEPVLPLVGSKRELDPAPLLHVEALTTEKRRLTWPRSSPPAFPVDGANLALHRGETLCLLGPSGCGKTSFLHALSGLSPSSHGMVRFEDRDITHARGQKARRLRRELQLVSQDPASVLDPQRSVRSHLQSAATMAGIRGLHLEASLEKVGLPTKLLDVLVDQLSASESQRVDVARSLIVTPKVVLWDAPEISGGDTDGGVLAGTLRQEKAQGRAFLLATQSPQVARALADRIAVMYFGRIIEVGSTDEVLLRPAHSFTAAYLNATPITPGNPGDPPLGCPHLSCCPWRNLPLCEENEPKLEPLVAGGTSLVRRSLRRQVACFFPNGTDRRQVRSSDAPGAP